MVLTQVFQAPKWWNNIGIHQKIRTRFFFSCHLPDIIHSASKDRSGISYIWGKRKQIVRKPDTILKWDELAIICKVTFLQNTNINKHIPLCLLLFNGKTLKLYYQTGIKSTIETCFLWIVMEGIVLHSCWNKCKNNKNFFQTRGHPSSNFSFASQKK